MRIVYNIPLEIEKEVSMSELVRFAIENDIDDMEIAMNEYCIFDKDYIVDEINNSFDQIKYINVQQVSVSNRGEKQIIANNNFIDGDEKKSWIELENEYKEKYDKLVLLKGE